jgi:hypothetical protein
MATIQDQTLSEVVDFADVAVRTASQLRLAKAGRPFTDREILQHSLAFLDRAKQGGAFMSKKTAQFSDTLRPLNWAADTYLSPKLSPQAQPDYGKVEDYLTQLVKPIRELFNGATTADPQDLERAIALRRWAKSLVHLPTRDCVGSGQNGRWSSDRPCLCPADFFISFTCRSRLKSTLSTIA